jgi:hypothetical protein
LAVRGVMEEFHKIRDLLFALPESHTHPLVFRIYLSPYLGCECVNNKNWGKKSLHSRMQTANWVRFLDCEYYKNQIFLSSSLFSHLPWNSQLWMKHSLQVKVWIIHSLNFLFYVKLINYCSFGFGSSPSFFSNSLSKFFYVSFSLIITYLYFILNFSLFTLTK